MLAAARGEVELPAFRREDLAARLVEYAGSFVPQ